MKILLADKFPNNYLNKLATNHECSYQPEISEGDLPNIVSEFDAVIVRSTKITSDTINKAEHLKLIVRAGAGTNTIDKSAARAKNIDVCNTPGKNAVAVAELAMGLLLSVDRNIPANNNDLKSNIWNKSAYSKADGIYGKSVGVLGFGAIGIEFAKRAKAFGLNIHTLDRNDSLIGTDAINKLSVSLHSDINSLAKSVDILSIHLPLNENTKHIINQSVINDLAENSIIINTSRGEIIDESALLDGLNNKGIRAGLDVFQNEPSSSRDEFISKIAKHKSVYGTHHIGASTTQAQNAVAEEVINVIDSFQTNSVINVVN